LGTSRLIDLVDYQSLPDKEYKFVLHYKEQLTKFSFFRPLVCRKTVEVAKVLLVLTYGAPTVLQSDNGREFTAEIIREVASLWPSLKLVNGRPRYPQSQGSVERGNGPLKDSLTAWMRDNRTTEWSVGLPFLQWGINNTYHETIRMTPYEAVFDQKAGVGLGTGIPPEFLEKITTGVYEEDMLILLEEQDADSRSSEVSQVYIFTSANIKPYFPLYSFILTEVQ